MSATHILGAIKHYYLEDFEKERVLKGFVDRFRDKNNNLIITPNRVTTARVILIFPGLLLMHLDFSLHLVAAAAYISIILWLDRLDGLIAKERKLTSQFGKYYDPAMDKVTEAILLLTFVSWYDLWSISEPTIFLISIVWYLIAELALFAISLYKYRISIGHPRKFIAPEKEGANRYGKTKTGISFTGIVLITLLLESNINPDFFAPAYIAAFVLAILSAREHLAVIQNKSA